MGSLSLLQGTFPTQGSNPGVLHCGLILYQLSHKGSPRILEWVAYPFSRGSSWPRNRTRVSALQADSLPTELSGKPCSYLPSTLHSVFLVITPNSHSACLSFQRTVVKKTDRCSSQIPCAEILPASWMWIIGRMICLPLWVVVQLSNVDNHSADLRVAVRIKWLTYKKLLTTGTGTCRELRSCHSWSWWRWLGWLLWDCAQGWRSR